MLAYLIDRGRVEISTVRDGEPLVIAMLGPGELFGEMALIDDQSRMATATALEETEVVVIGRDQLQEKIEQADPVLALLLRVILQRYRRSIDHVLSHEKAAKEDSETDRGKRDWILENTRHHVISQIRSTEELQRAIQRKQFALHYQPIVRCATGELAGLEALIRWQHPSRGLLPPGEFISHAEDLGLVGRIGLWVLEQACSDLLSFHQAARENPGTASLPFMSVNLSPRQLQSLDEVGRLVGVPQDVGIDPAYVKLEITENLLIQNPELATQILADLKKVGFRLAIDDFGTGYSSLSYLHRFPLDTLKIDRSFVQTMVKNRGSLQVVRAIAGLAQELDMDIIAEGVGTVEQLQTLAEIGCDFVQGYLWSKPLPFTEALALVREGSSRPHLFAGMPR